MLNKLRSMLSMESIPTLSEMPRYVARHDKRGQVKEKTISWYIDAVVTLIKSIGDDIKVTALRVDDLRRWQNAQENSFAVSTANGRKRAIQAQLNKLAVIGVLENYRDRGKVVASLSDCIVLKPEGRKSCRAMKETTYEAMFAKANIKWRAVLAVMWETGIRRAELCSSRVDKLEFFNSEGGEQCCKFWVMGKQDRPRWVACKGKSAELLFDYVQNHRPRTGDTNAVFIGRGTNPLSIHSVNSEFRRLTISAEIPRGEPTNPHSTRHAFALRMLDKGHAPNVVAAMMGIDPVTFMENYVTPHDEQVFTAFLS